MYICGVTRNGLQTYFFTRKRKCYSLIVRNLVNFKKTVENGHCYFCVAYLCRRVAPI